MKIYPTILTDSIAVCQQQVREVSSVAEIETVQIDVIDGHYVDNLTVTPADLVEVNFFDLSLDFHLMVEEPLNHLYEILEFKDQLPARAVIAQIERMTCQSEFIKDVKKNGLKPGLSLDLFTPLEALDYETWNSELEVIQLMAVEAGHQGQEMQPLLFEKLQKLKRLMQEYSVNWEIVVDGGVKITNVKRLEEAGVEAVSVGSQIWRAEDKERVIQKLAL
ncbi:MAG: hypothetical protein U9O78_00675 [Patescibacteria group bacterium]|nr:hypothetical protein [Patescibacteria group bacterium]